MSSNHGKSPDLRVRRTRMMIEKAFIELLQEKDFQEITIQDIADRAMVNRATFYDHFIDKYALLRHAMRAWFQQTLESKLPADLPYCTSTLGLLIETLGEFLEKTDNHCRLNNPQDLPTFDEQVVELISELLLTWIEDKHMGNMPSPPRLIVDVASWAMYGAARHWSKQKPRKPIKDFAMSVAPMISALGEQSESTMSGMVMP